LEKVCFIKLDIIRAVLVLASDEISKKLKPAYKILILYIINDSQSKNNIKEFLALQKICKKNN
jgi:hypothetical protein